MPALAIKGPTVALAALMFMFSLIPFGHAPQAEIYGYQNNIFWGVMMVDGAKVPLVVEVEVPNNSAVDKAKEDSKSEKQPEPPTPGKVKITFQKKGEDVRFEYNRDMGAGEISPQDQERIDKVVDAVLKYSEKATTKHRVAKRVVEFLKNVKVRPKPIFFK